MTDYATPARAKAGCLAGIHRTKRDPIPRPWHGRAAVHGANPWAAPAPDGPKTIHFPPGGVAVTARLSGYWRSATTRRTQRVRPRVLAAFSFRTGFSPPSRRHWRPAPATTHLPK